jgi:GR25 family glycosyltransferase involved in LPS biosynthesis
MGAKKSKPTQVGEAIIVKPNGGLGNQLFEIANGYAYSLRYNKRFYITGSWGGITKDRPTYWNNYLKNLKPYLITPKRIRKIKVYKEPKFSYKKIYNVKGHICFEGYYQSEKYFEDYREAVRKLFALPDDLKPTFIKEGICVAIHIRRGDYLTKSDFHINIEKFYYDNAKKLIEEKLGFRPNYYYFSDDITWVKETFKESDPEVSKNDKFISGFKDYEELYIMSLCDHFIIANSSFSWWGAWLSVAQSEENKIVIAPDTWFGPSGIQDYEDIYPKKSIKMNIDGSIKDLIIRSDAMNSKLSLNDNFEFINSNNQMIGKIFYNFENETIVFCKNDGKILINHRKDFSKPFLDNYNRNSNMILSKDNIKELQYEFIKSRIKDSELQNDKYNLYLINLEKRTDRKSEFLSQSQVSELFNVNIFNAISFPKGWIGCGLSHMYLVYYALMNNLPYIIVAEDDCDFKLDNNQIKNILDTLLTNLDDWDVFNGSPSFSDKTSNLKDIDFTLPKSEILKKDFVKTTWGQATSFMIYNKSSYSKLLQYSFNCIIDQFVSNNFNQIIYKHNPFSIQRASFSDLGLLNPGKKYEDFFIKQYDIIKSVKVNEEEKTIGIYSIFIGKYKVFYENLIKTCEERFLPKYKKYYYIVTDDLELPKYNDRTFFFNTEMIGWPYETLYRFKYFLKFNKEDIDKSDYIYFINGNGQFLDTIGKEVLPDSSGYSFTRHFGYINKQYGDLGFEKDNHSSTAYIPNKSKFNFYYFAGGFYGAKKDKFIEMSTILDKNISKDEKNNYIAIWHDESHINYYCNVILKNNFKHLGNEFHIPQESMDKYKNKRLMYLLKKTYILDTTNVKNLHDGNKNRFGKVKKNKYNS